jgi:hypothetical protein
MSSPRLLVCEGNTAELRAKQVEAGGVAMSDGYADLLRELLPGAVVDICYPADPGANLPLGGVEGYDGVAITGSALNVYDGGPAIEPQIDKSAFSGIPDLKGKSRFYEYQYMLDQKVDEYRKAGKNPVDLIDPSKPEYNDLTGLKNKPKATAAKPRKAAVSKSAGIRRRARVIELGERRGQRKLTPGNARLRRHGEVAIMARSDGVSPG